MQQYSRMPFMKRKALTFAELTVAVLIFAIVSIGIYQMMQSFLGRHAAKISKRLNLQIEARRALVNLYQDIQEGIEILKPNPGFTLPYLILRDNVNDLHFIFQKKDIGQSELLKKDIFRLYSVKYDMQEERIATGPRELLKNIERLNFTAHGYAEVVIASTLQDGEALFSFVNMIGLKNACAEEGL